LEQNVHFSPLKILNSRQHSFQKLPHFSQGNNVLYVPPSDVDGFLLRDTYVSSTQLNRTIWDCLEQIDHFSSLKTFMRRQYSFQKLNQFSQVNKVLDAPASTLDGFLLRDTCVSKIQLNMPIWNKFSVTPL
jgi:hypothetical protein